MRALVLLVALAGCVPQGVYRVEVPLRYYTGYAVSTTTILGTIHSPRVGTVVYILTRRGRQRAVVVRRVGDKFWFVGDPYPLALTEGMSGAVILGVLLGRIAK